MCCCACAWDKSGVYYGLDFPFSKLSKAKRVSGTYVPQLSKGRGKTNLFVPNYQRNEDKPKYLFLNRGRNEEKLIHSFLNYRRNEDEPKYSFLYRSCGTFLYRERLQQQNGDMRKRDKVESTCTWLYLVQGQICYLSPLLALPLSLLPPL